MESNRKKYNTYKSQHEQLTKALEQAFYYEAMFIEYAIIEDRMTSIIAYGEITTKKGNRPEKLHEKLIAVMKLVEKNDSLENKYFGGELLDHIMEWKSQRNELIHELMEKPKDEYKLKGIAIEGSNLVTELQNKSTSYKRAVTKRKKENQ